MSKDPAFLFYPNEWRTPNTYNSNYGSPSGKGVYLLVDTKFDNTTIEHNILYIGSSKNLSKRYANHEVLRILKEFYNYVQFYWRNEIDYRYVEKQLIQSIQPKFNTQWR